MTDTTTLGPYLRRERECRGLALRAIAEATKVSIALLEGLEADDISRWPGGIFRRAFVRSYAQCVGLDPDDVVRRFELQFAPPQREAGDPTDGLGPLISDGTRAREIPGAAARSIPASRRARLMGTAADLTVALVLALGSAAAGSRLLWPVLLIAAYYAAGILLTGTSPMVSLLGGSTLESGSLRRAPRSPRHPEEPLQDAAEHWSDGATGQRGLPIRVQ